jgi:outer membrane protein insertion porin family
MGRLAVLGLLGWLVLTVATAAAAAASDGPVVAVRIEADGAVDAEQVLRVLGLTVGEPIDRRQVRDGLKTLYAGGEINWAAVKAAPTEGGLEAVVEIGVRSPIESVSISGIGWWWQIRVRRWLGVDPGDLFSEAALAEGIRRVRRELVERGWANAVVDPTVTYDRASNSVAVSVAVDRGVPQRLVDVVVSGVEDPEPVLRELEGARGAVLTDEREDRLRSRTVRSLRRSGWWEAEVVEVRQRQVADGVVVELEVDAGPAYRWEVAAPPTLAKPQQYLPDPGTDPIYPAQTLSLAERVREALQLDGYLLAEVSAELEADTTPRVLRVTIDSGVRRKVKKVLFAGAEAIDRDDLLEVVRVRRGSTRGWRGQQVSEPTLEEDRLAIKQSYEAAGFAQVEVAPARLEPVGPDRVRVVFEIDEGPRWTVTELGLEGVPVEVHSALETIGLGLVQGGPWSALAVEEARQRFEATLANNGYPEGRVTVDVDTSDVGRAKVVLEAHPGPFVIIDELVVSGLRRTREPVVERALERAGLEAGMAYSVAAIVEAQRRLYQLGIFRRVTISPIPGDERATERTMVVRCEEGAQRSYLVGLGYDTGDGARITLGWSHLNLLGGAHAVGVEARVSEREQRLQLGVRETDLFGSGLPAYAVAYRTEEELAQYSQLRRGLWLELGDRRRRPLRPWLRYEYQIVQPDAPPEILSELERQDREIQIASITPTVEWDTRDDPFLPTRGVLLSLATQYAFPLFEANAHFLKVESSFALYGELANGYGAIGLRVGSIQPFDAPDDEPANLAVPLAARFFAGGRVSHRAFATDRLGVAGQTLDVNGDPIGGNALLLLNMEYRRPVWGFVDAVLFADAGNLWAEPSLVELDEVRWGIGLGVRVNTPAGPLRIEYGHKLEQRDKESSGEIFVSFGTAF